MAEIGQIIDNRYKILEEIGRGGMSVVYLASDNRLQKNWVVKEYRHGGKFQQLARDSLLQEAFILKKLEHPLLPRIVDIINLGDAIYIVRDYIAGEPLNKVIETRGAQGQDTVIEWFKQLLDVLNYMHTLTPPVVYRDLKPANIMLKPDGSIHLFDFGTAKEAGEGSKQFMALGTRGYAAPEQFHRDAVTDGRTDIYALGITVHYLLTGKNPTEPPFELLPIRQYNPFLSAELEAVVQKCVQLSPGDRYNSCGEILAELENMRADSENKGSKKTVAVVSGIAAFLAMAVIVVVVVMSLNRPDGSAASDGAVVSNPVITSAPVAATAAPTVAPTPTPAPPTIGDYRAAVATDEGNGAAYLDLLAFYRERMSEKEGKIRGDASSLNDGKDFLSSEIMSDFAVNRLDLLKRAHPPDYIEVNFRLGLLFWDFYEDKNSPVLFANTQQAKGFFEEALLENDGDRNYDLIKTFYLTSFFCGSVKDMRQKESKITAPAAALASGVKADAGTGIVANPYDSFWRALMEMVDTAEREKEIEIRTKRTSLIVVLGSILTDNYYFKENGGITWDEMVGILRSCNNLRTEISLNSKSEADAMQNDLLGELLDNVKYAVGTRYGKEID